MRAAVAARKKRFEQEKWDKLRVANKAKEIDEASIKKGAIIYRYAVALLWYWWWGMCVFYWKGMECTGQIYLVIQAKIFVRCLPLLAAAVHHCGCRPSADVIQFIHANCITALLSCCLTLPVGQVALLLTLKIRLHTSALFRAQFAIVSCLAGALVLETWF